MAKLTNLPVRQPVRGDIRIISDGTASTVEAFDGAEWMPVRRVLDAKIEVDPQKVAAVIRILTPRVEVVVPAEGASIEAAARGGVSVEV
ncbi:hypothetical protein RQ831_03935 [Roseomonas gilardii]|uniref:Phage tail protein n=1 Tax=Roseomonas gilardii TaxID=257708 RepID=A0ABU3MCJ9_9PROT|nr:hypothetical protein [Roseomonas gilardii]MDT8330191.1 hypothetical protein [Roseomonas gilardii]